MSIVSGANHDMGVARGEDLVGDDGRVGCAHSFGFLTSDKVRRGDVGEGDDLGVEEGTVDVLTASGSVACEQSGHDGSMGVKTCCQI